MKIKIKLANGATAPAYTRPGDAGQDLRANEDVMLPPGERMLVATGISVELPENYVAEIVPRSGLALKHGITCLNTPGIIDSNYRGEIHVMLINHGHRTFYAEKGERIAQMLIREIPHIEWDVVDELSETNRGADGFGSSGVK